VSQSERIVWLCEELELPYELKTYARDPVTRLAPPDYKALHPMGSAPVVTEGAFSLAESGAIIDYILAKHGKGRLQAAPGAPNFVDYSYWFHFANGTLMPRSMGSMVVTMMGAVGTPVGQFFQTRDDQAYATVETRLGQTPYFAGDTLTAADIMMVFPLTTMRYFQPRDFSAFPNIRAYLKRIGERPAYRRAMAKGDPGMALKLD
jgi:glutathione S-transferase